MEAWETGDVKKFGGEVALISGGLGDIGRAIAQDFAAGGADVALCDLQPKKEARGFLAALEKSGVRSSYDLVDVSDASATAAWVKTVEQEIGLPSIIIPNAAQVTMADCQQITPDQWDRELRVNLDGAFYLARSAALRLIEWRKRGRIVFIGSWTGHRAHPHIPAYTVSKAGLRMLCRCMALEFAPYGILVNEVAPGYVDAGLSGRVLRQHPELRKKLRQLVPVKQLVQPEEVARAVAFLCDPENKQITGSVLVQDGGVSLLPPKP